MMNKILSLSVSLLESVSTLSSYKKSSLILRNMGSVCGKNIAPVKSDTMANQTEEFVESAVCKEKDISDNQMKIFDVEGGGQVLIVKQNGKLSALGTKCTHLGASLDKAALGEGRIRCQWHGACFNTTTGDIEDYPGLDSLPCYQVFVKDNQILVQAKKSDLTSNKRVRSMTKTDNTSQQKVVIIGGGPSGATCLEKLRQEGFNGHITLINKENCLPYDRTKVSKVLDFDINKFQLRNLEFYKDIAEVMVNTEVRKVDTYKKVVILDNKEVPFNYLYIATGCSAKKLEIPGGNDSDNILTLRNYEDIKKLNSKLNQNVELVVLGVSFIAMEIAATCAQKVKSVTVIGRDSAPFKNTFGEQIGMHLLNLFEKNGIKFYLNSGIKECLSEDGALKSIVLNNGTKIPASLLVMGVGSTYNTSFLDTSGVEVNPDGSIPVNEYLETNVKNVFAGGDIAEAPVYVSNNEKSTIGHYGLAHFHGKIAALNILKKKTPVNTVPYFWTMLFGKGIRYAGHGKFNDIKIYGDLDNLKFIAYYFKNDEVIAMSSCQRDPVVSQFAEMLQHDKRISKKDVEVGNLPWSNE